MVAEGALSSLPILAPRSSGVMIEDIDRQIGLIRVGISIANLRLIHAVGDPASIPTHLIFFLWHILSHCSLFVIDVLESKSDADLRQSIEQRKQE